MGLNKEQDGHEGQEGKTTVHSEYFQRLCKTYRYKLCCGGVEVMTTEAAERTRAAPKERKNVFGPKSDTAGCHI